MMISKKKLQKHALAAGRENMIQENIKADFQRKYNEM